ncbi:TPA: AI-2E family transporter [Candidatus Woesearchaeota archaeon]|nr:AI-2E family transporter [Candidatus Woesearchaeota archaeon]
MNKTKKRPSATATASRPSTASHTWTVHHDDKKDKQVCSRHVAFVLFFIAITAASAFIVKPFFTVIVVSAILAYVLHPAYEGFRMMLKRKGFAAGAVVFLLFLLVLFPMILIVSTVTKESIGAYQYVKDQVSESGMTGYCKEPTRFGCGVYEYVAQQSEKYGIDIRSHMKEGALMLAAGLVKKASDLVLNLPTIFLQFFFILFMTYYFLKQGDEWLQAIKDALPLDKQVSENIVSKFNDVMHATLYGAVVMAIIQGTVAAIGYFLLGAPSPILFGFLTTIAVFVPFVGGALVWLPLSFYMLIDAVTIGSTVLVYKAIGLFLFGMFVISMIDNILKPKIIGDRAKMHPLLILLGVFGGLAVFGIIGILIGPLILAMFMTSLKLYEQQKHNIRL